RASDPRTAGRAENARPARVGPSHGENRGSSPLSDIDTAVLDSLKVLDPRRPIREADIVRVIPAASFSRTPPQACRNLPSITSQPASSHWGACDPSAFILLTHRRRPATIAATTLSLPHGVQNPVDAPP